VNWRNVRQLLGSSLVGIRREILFDVQIGLVDLCKGRRARRRDRSAKRESRKGRLQLAAAIDGVRGRGVRGR